MLETRAVSSPYRLTRRTTKIRDRGGSAALGASLLALMAAALLIWPTVASADSSSTLTVIGTSDVSDSGLIANLIQPDFQKAYPQYTFKYIGTATGTAISGAESGAQGASALIVHAASLENQFVAGGYSYERYGRAIFTNDFVFAGPKADPAGVAGNAAHNIAQAFADVAAAGINGGGSPRATFVSRGGTPGTTVQEHQIWQLVDKNGMAPSGLLLCAVNSKNGGGETPIAAGNGVTAPGQPCPNGGALPSGGQLPDWYAVTGLTQGPNVQNANACNGYKSGPNSCYVLTDRGTYDYLASGTDPAGSISNLTIVTRDDSASAPGGAYALINYFHAYIINPSKPGEQVNLTAAKAFLNLLTSPSFQSQLKNYLPNADPGGPPFVADASPIITASPNPDRYRAGKRVTVTGTVTNAEPGYPTLAGVPVSVAEVVGLIPIPVASTTTNSSGGYSIHFVPRRNASYEVVTPQIAKVENATLNPPFGDLLSPGAISLASGTADVQPEGGKALITGSVAPGYGSVNAKVTVAVRRAGSRRPFKRLATVQLAGLEGNFAVLAHLAAGRWEFRIRYSYPGQVLGAYTRIITATIGPPSASSVGFRTIHVLLGALTLTGTARPAGSAGSKVELLGMNTTAGTRASLRVLKVVRVRVGRKRFTLQTNLKRGSRWILQIAYVVPGKSTAFSGLRSVSVS